MFYFNGLIQPSSKIGIGEDVREVFFCGSSMGDWFARILEESLWTEEHSAELRRLETRVDFSLPLPFFVYVDKVDEVIDWGRSAAKHSPIARLLVFDGGCRSFDHVAEALVDLKTEFTK